MNESIFKNISKKLVPRNYLDVGLEANRTKSKIFQEILEKVVLNKVNYFL